MATINQMANYSFNFYGGSSANSTSSLLGDYASIRNGSYKKLLKAYYSKEKQAEGSNSTSGDSTKTIASVQQTSAKLMESADVLTAKGTKNLFKEKDITTKDENGSETTTRGYDKDAIYKAVNNFVNDYNSMIKEGQKSESMSVLRSTLSMTRSTYTNRKMLQEVGITIGADNKLTIDEETFKKADMNTVKTLFNGSNSYAGNISDRASRVKSAAASEALKANTYNNTARYSNPYSMGSMYNSFF